MRGQRLNSISGYLLEDAARRLAVIRFLALEIFSVADREIKSIELTHLNRQLLIVSMASPADGRPCN